VATVELFEAIQPVRKIIMSARTIRPTGNHVLVKPIPVATKTESGLLELPVAYQQPSGQGWVVAVGPGRYDKKGNLIPTDLKPGDKIIYSWLSSVELDHTEDSLVMLDKSQVLGVCQ
jgi:chaperonin GroES